jgi:sugar/nucleoside kinase (ribokinase family)
VSVAIVGSVSLDRIEGSPPRIGGGPYHCARGLRALGTRATIVAKCAAPDRSRIVPRLAGLGFPVLWRDSAATASFAIDYDGEHRRMLVEAIADPWTPEEVQVPATWVHVAPLARSDFPPETLAALARGRRVSFDGQGLVRPARLGPLEPDGDFDADLLRCVSILKLAEDEAALLVDGLDERSLAALGVPEVVVTLGSRGCVVFHEGVAELVRSHRVDNPDPTGAGDAFAATYLAARSTGAAPTAAARRAAALVADVLAGRAA